MPMSRSSITNTGVCRRSARSKAAGAELERLRRVLGEQQHVLGVAVGRVGAGHHVGLLGTRRHAGRGAGPLHVEDHGGNLGEIGQAEEFLHQRDPGPEVAVNARAPFQAAPITMPIEASSSSAWMIATFSSWCGDRRAAAAVAGERICQ